MESVKTNLYEMLTIIPPSRMGDITDVKKAIEEVIEKSGGEILQAQELGERGLAYSIKGLQSGYYFLFDLRLPSSSITRLNSLFTLSPDVLRHMIVKKEEVKRVKEEKKKAVEKVAVEEVKAPEVKTDIDLELGL